MAIKQDHQAKYFIKEQAKVITFASHPHSNNYYAGWNIQCEFPWSNNEAFNYCGWSCSEGEQSIISISAHTSDHPSCSPPPPKKKKAHCGRLTASSLQHSFGSQRHKTQKSRTNPRHQLVWFFWLFFFSFCWQEEIVHNHNWKSL